MLKKTVEKPAPIVMATEDEILDAEAVEAGKAKGVSPEVSRSILEARPYLMAGFAAIGAVAILAVGFVLGLNSSTMLVNSAHNASNSATNHSSNVKTPYGYDNDSQYLDGYQNGFYDGLNYNRYQGYPVPYAYNSPYAGYGVSGSGSTGGADGSTGGGTLVAPPEGSTTAPAPSN